MPGPIDYNEIASAQLDAKELINLLNSDNSLQLKKIKIPNSDLELYCDVSTDTCTHVFVRRDSVRRPLQAPYDGPYPVIKRSDKFYKVNIHGKSTLISIDRLKPAFTHNVDDTLHIEKSDTETKPNLRKTRSGRRVHFPDYFVSS
ncbi:pol polyprotein [Trichonephila clavata]|uniref:Pol polyprotein n=1 Tax=Trichonephila clavata TaxID=2740835 RepID=A0A8X6FB09_TRICU|nr:pol polyprotein [Trichonephila clavata]